MPTFPREETDTERFHSCLRDEVELKRMQSHSPNPNNSLFNGQRRFLSEEFCKLCHTQRRGLRTTLPGFDSRALGVKQPGLLNLKPGALGHWTLLFPLPHILPLPSPSCPPLACRHRRAAGGPQELAWPLRSHPLALVSGHTLSTLHGPSSRLFAAHTECATATGAGTPAPAPRRRRRWMRGRKPTVWIQILASRARASL